MGTVDESLEPDDYTDPHPAEVLSDEDMALAAALKKYIDNKTCAVYLKEAAIPWLARLEA